MTMGDRITPTRPRSSPTATDDRSAVTAGPVPTAATVLPAQPDHRPSDEPSALPTR